VKFASNIEVSSYLLTWQDVIETQPVVKILTENPRLDMETEFEITVPVHAGSMIRIDFGDNSKPVTYHISELELSTGSTHTFTISHVYVVVDDSAKIQLFNFQVRQANYMSETSAQVNLSFEIALSDFKLTVSETELIDISDKPILFKISTY
jgi:hypothetical protein